MSSRDAATALMRFGLGPRPGEMARMGNGARAALLAALERKDAALIRDPSLEPSHVVHAAAVQAGAAVKIARAFGSEGDSRLKAPAKDGAAAGRPAEPGETMAMSGRDATAGSPSPAAADPAGKAAEPANPTQIRRAAFRSEMTARLERARTTDEAFLERLVMFWSNHFCVSVAKGSVLGMAGAYEREAIRPHVLGRFADMLKAVEQHPAMLSYLDNQASTGPNSRIGRNRNRGLNENLAREILELHTLGVDGGYTQADVTSLARLITGWTVGQPGQAEAVVGQFFFAAPRHEPGLHTVLGRRYGNDGVAAGERCLADLARHPSTGRHVARKLAIHFVSDTPPPALVGRLETAFRDSDGDLAVVARALLTADEAWTAVPRKLLPPYDFIVAVQRAFGLDQPSPLERARLMAALGQPLWRPPSPKGWPEADDAWAAPSALRERLRIAERIGQMVAQRGQDPRELAEQLLGPAMSDATRQAIARAEAREQAVALLVMSPDFLRR